MIFHTWNEWFMAQNFYQNTVSDEQIQQQQSLQPPKVGWMVKLCYINAEFHVKFVKRQANSVAHLSVKVANS
jgi:hypothetical protein